MNKDILFDTLPCLGFLDLWILILSMNPYFCQFQLSSTADEFHIIPTIFFPADLI